MTLTWYRRFKRNGGLNQILKRQSSRSHYGSKVPAVTITVFKYRNKMLSFLFVCFVLFSFLHFISGCTLFFQIRLCSTRYFRIYEYIQFRFLSSCNSIKPFDFSILYTTNPHSKLKASLRELVQLCFIKQNSQRRYK